MANHPSAARRNRQRITRTKRNRAVKTETRSILKKARVQVATGDKEVSVKVVKTVSSAVDRAAAKGVIHKKAAARAKSRIALRAHKAAKTA